MSSMAGTHLKCFSKYFNSNFCQSFVDKANQFHPNIKSIPQIGKSISFLDVFIENNNGVLTTSVNHKEMSEPYIVPFKSDHPRYIFKNIIDATLIRAIQYSSTLSAFNTERRSIKLMLLYNGYD